MLAFGGTGCVDVFHKECLSSLVKLEQFLVSWKYINFLFGDVSIFRLPVHSAPLPANLVDAFLNALSGCAAYVLFDYNCTLMD